MKGSPEYVDWLESIHKKTRLPKVQVFRIALEEWASRNGHGRPRRFDRMREYALTPDPRALRPRR